MLLVQLKVFAKEKTFIRSSENAILIVLLFETVIDDNESKKMPIFVNV